MSIALVFDVYGTLIDTKGVVKKLQAMIGQKASAFSDLWRTKQVEYSFRCGLMQHHITFEDCTEHALNYCCLHFKVLLSESQKQALLQTYASLPAFDDVQPCLASLKTKGIPLYAFSNGSKKAVSSLLANAHIDSYFNNVISVDEVKSFKPAPVVYQHLVEQIPLPDAIICLLSANTFDVLGALSYGLDAIWLKRWDAVLDPWGLVPTATINALEYSLLAEKLDFKPCLSVR